MEENVERVKIPHETYQREIKDLKLALWYVVLAAGGKVKVDRCHLWHDLKDIDWKIEHNVADDTKTFSAKLKVKNHEN